MGIIIRWETVWEGQEVIVVNSEPIVSRQTHVLYP